MIKSIILFLILSAGGIFASNMATELFDEGNILYEKASYDSAITVYSKILSMGYHDSRVYYNLGNSYFRKKEIGQAVLNFEKALLLNPSDNDAKNNLLFARAATVDKIIPPETGFLTKIILSLHNSIGLYAQTLLVLLLLYLLSFLVIIYFLVRNNAREFVKPVAFVVLILFVPVMTSFAIKVYAETNSKEAVVLSAQLNAVNEPDGSQVLFTVHEGSKFALHRKVGNFYFGSLENGLSGWIPESDLGIIEINE